MNVRRVLSIIVPCYNEEDNVKPIYNLLVEEMSRIPQYDYEIVFRDNASTDNTYERLKEIAKKDKKVKIIENIANYGPGARGATYKKYISGDVVISLACDLQDPVELIPEFLGYYEQGYKVVAGQKISSEEGKAKYFLRRVFYNTISLFSERKQYKHVSGIMLMSRDIFDLSYEYIDQMPLRYFLAELGCPVKIIPYRQNKRIHGKSKLKVHSLLEFSIQALVLTSTRPIHIATITGFCSALICLIIGAIYLVKKVLYWKTFQMGVAPLIVGVFFVGSMQLFFTGIIGEYLAIVINRVSKTPPSLVKETINMDQDDGEI